MWGRQHSPKPSATSLRIHFISRFTHVGRDSKRPSQTLRTLVGRLPIDHTGRDWPLILSRIDRPDRPVESSLAERPVLLGPRPAFQSLTQVVPSGIDTCQKAIVGVGSN
jgi:hypothetical protein